MKSTHQKKLGGSAVSTLQRSAAVAGALALVFGSGHALAQRPLGVDVSDIQGSGINWSSVKSAGYTFSWAKATEGTGYIASSFVPNMNNGKGAGVFMGAYDFARPDLVTPTSEAAYFWAEAGSHIAADGKTLMPMLDYETFNGVTGASTYSSWATQWYTVINNDLISAGLTGRPVLYTTTCEACNVNGSCAELIPWIANPSGEAAQTGTPWDYTSCDSCDIWGTGAWTVWQYDWNGVVSGIPGTVDRDVFNGNASGLASTLLVSSAASPHINPCVARTSDGRLDLFAVGKTGNLYHNYQTTGGWSGWVALGTSGNVWSQNVLPCVGTNADGRLEVFIVGTDGSVNHIWQKVAGSSASTNWGSFTTFSSHLNQTAKLAVGNWANGALDLFAVGTDGVLYHNYQTAPSGGWFGFVSLGGSWSQNADIAVGNEKDGRMEVFMVGSTGNLYNNWSTAANGTTWNGWSDIGGALSGTVRLALGHNTDGRLEIFAVGTDGVSYHNWEKTANTPTGWNGWAGLGGNWETDVKPVVGIDQNGAMEVFIIGNTGNMYHNYQNGGAWSGWISLTGGFTQNVRPCIGQNKTGTLELFLTGPSADMQHAYQTSANSSTWVGWSSLGGSWN